MRYAFLNQSDFICVKEYCCVSSAASDSDLRDLLCVCVCEMRLNDRWCGFMSFFSISPLFCQSDSSFPWRTDLLFNHHCQHTRTRTHAHTFWEILVFDDYFFLFLWTCWIKSHSAWLLLYRNPLCDIMYSVNICALSVTGSTQISQRNKILSFILILQPRTHYWLQVHLKVQSALVSSDTEVISAVGDASRSAHLNLLALEEHALKLRNSSNVLILFKWNSYFPPHFVARSRAQTQHATGQRSVHQLWLRWMQMCTWTSSSLLNSFLFDNRSTS